jgi:hypothetical protein
MSNQCRALLRRTDGKPCQRRWCLVSPAVEHDFICELGHETRRPVCATHAPVSGRLVNGDLWVCKECPVIAAEGLVFLAAWDEERRRAELLAQPVRWFHYMTDGDHRRRTKGREREGHLMTTGREPKAWAGRQYGRGRAVWILPDDRWSDRLFVKIWWDPDRPELNYSLEEWQGVQQPAASPIDGAPDLGDGDWYECDRYFAERHANDGELWRLTACEPLLSDEARRIWVDGQIDDISQASEAVLLEIECLLGDEDRRTKLLARNEELLSLIDRNLERREAAGAY